MRAAQPRPSHGRFIASTLGLFASFLCATGIAFAQSAPSSPAPAPTEAATPSGSAAPAAGAPSPQASSSAFTYRGYVRAYDLTRLNADPGINAVNQRSITPGISLHADYKLGASPVSVGGSFFYDTPFNGCTTPASTLRPPCGGFAAPTNAVSADNTLPGYAMRTFYEAYVRYHDTHFTGTIGDQLLTTPFANSADSRLKPEAYQGADLNYTASNGLLVEVAEINRFESRTNSSFDNHTLLTAVTNLGGGSGLPAFIAYPGGNGPTTGGFQYGRIGYTAPASVVNPLAVNLYDYQFDSIANLGWLDAKYTLGKQRFKPFFAVQGGRERNTGSAQLGGINSFAYGAQIGAAVSKTVTLSMGFDAIPQHSTTVATAAGSACARNVASSAAGRSLPYFIGTNDPSCIRNSDGTTTYLYGGLVSPYTDSYAADPLFTTSISQGMVDRRAPGDSVKLAASYTSPNKQFVLLASRAYYNYGYYGVGEQQTAEFDADAQYFFNKIRRGAYKGFSLRYRYADRQQSNVAQFGGTPDFKYNRAQFEFDF